LACLDHQLLQADIVSKYWEVALVPLSDRFPVDVLVAATLLIIELLFNLGLQKNLLVAERYGR
jgi:hypothetical protein